jgi:hypothetical protein
LLQKTIGKLNQSCLVVRREISQYRDSQRFIPAAPFRPASFDFQGHLIIALLANSLLEQN